MKVLSDLVDTYLPIFTDIINNSIRNGTFPEEIKLAEVIPLFKKADPFWSILIQSINYSIKSVNTSKCTFLVCLTRNILC